MLQSLTALVVISFALQGVNAQTPSIKQTVGTWQAKGCYQDFGPRILTYRFDVPAGNNAERCTAICASNGYGLAGLEYGSECWCDKYMPFGLKAPDSDCSFTCPGDPTELCGAGNRLVLYQNTAATPPDPNQCINWRDTFNVVLDAVAKTGGARTRLYLYAEDGRPPPIYYNWYASCPGDVSTCPYRDYTNSWIDGGVLQAGFEAKSVFPVVGDSPTFRTVFRPLTQTPFTGYCAKPNPYAPYGGFMGYPLLSVSGSTNSWAVCLNNTQTNGRVDLVYSPVANHPHYNLADCQDVWVELAKANLNDFV